MAMTAATTRLWTTIDECERDLECLVPVPVQTYGYNTPHSVVYFCGTEFDTFVDWSFADFEVARCTIVFDHQ
jgi:hypothetical protein